MPPETHTPSTDVLGRIHDLSPFRNGIESQETLPLWMLPETHTVSIDVLGRIHDLSSFRNGIESQETLPLWWLPETHTGTEGPTLFASQHFFDYLIDDGAEARYGRICR